MIADDPKSGLKSWQEITQDRAMLLMTTIQNEFMRRVNQGCSLMPKNDNQHRVEYLNIFFDAMIGNLAFLISSYGSASQQTEDAVVAGLKNKFNALRMAELGKKGESVKVETEPKHG